ncbi:divalent-cation tolerance protein CutA [Vibrio sp. CAU 1672]|uniref:divalent-cation tolerance protein CutA n=1 Tax=Vibrio sp. CAU 1672 TaxID=3032594 RepID=UPI0023DB407A|nr:divalent-cation tolerance protein CutA [Vibrio sp. CAU 1672]MDF2154799.1 divalent-cation tolerance protein CutA [Vibrio sp. CAU 1672]
MTQQHEYCIVLSTAGSENNRQQIINGLLAAELAACIQTMPIQSHYVWQGNVCHEEEWLLVIKTRCDLYPDVESKIIELHDYEVPQVVQVPIADGFNPYLTWLSQSTLDVKQ